MTEPLELSVSEFVALLNQTLEFAYPSVVVTGELANFRVSKNRWVYFDLKDETSSVKCFGTVYQLPGPLEDGMLLQVRATPRLHQLYGFSLNILSLRPAGEGSIKKAAALLQTKLEAEGLFDPARKRPLPYPPARIGLITSAESAAFADFIKVLKARWGGAMVELIDTQVQGEAAPAQLVAAIEQFNAQAEPPEVLVLIRGGGSAEDLAAFSTEAVTRAVAASRVPTLVAIGHEVDLSLAELAADVRASTPSNAAELLTPDRQHELAVLQDNKRQLAYALQQLVKDQRASVEQARERLIAAVQQLFVDASSQLKLKTQLLEAYNPNTALQRGYAIIRDEKQLITSVKQLKLQQAIQLQLSDGSAAASITSIKSGK
ncbi:MAG TPA: exodeoxyribonuclease VII large subunit [Candidatus Saccharimonadales bacterium]|nr:exodeoxyribonuclease VII large subunit [Candidatus Saccharimonadales bacterium]